MPGINFYEICVLIVLALVLLGPERLQQYAQNLGRWARKARSLTYDAKVRFTEETGADFTEIDWHKYDPRQYDPRRIIRQALAEDYDDIRSEVDSLGKISGPREPSTPVGYTIRSGRGPGAGKVWDSGAPSTANDSLDAESSLHSRLASEADNA